MTEVAVGIGESVIQSTGIVTEAIGSEWRVRTGSGIVTAHRAASCHLVPAPNDLVVLAVLETGRAYILAVLEREEGSQQALMRFDEGVRIEGKKVTLAAEEELEQRAASISTTTTNWLLNATTARIRSQAVNVVSQSLESAIESAELAASRLKVVANRFTERSKYHFRYVDELERVKAHAVNWLVERAFHLVAENAVLQAADLVKADGKQVHIG